MAAWLRFNFFFFTHVCVLQSKAAGLLFVAFHVPRRSIWNNRWEVSNKGLVVVAVVVVVHAEAFRAWKTKLLFGSLATDALRYWKHFKWLAMSES